MPVKTKRKTGAHAGTVWKYWVAEWQGLGYRGGLLGWEIQIDNTPVGHRALIYMKFFPDITFCWSAKRGPWKWLYTRWTREIERAREEEKRREAHEGNQR